MLSLTYSGPDVHGFVTVKLDNKFVGRIEPVEGGFRYFPKGSTAGGDKFYSLRACQQSLDAWIQHLRKH